MRGKFSMSKRPSLLLDSLKRQLYSYSVYSTHTTQTVRTTQSGIEQVYWHERRHCSRLLSGDDWKGSIGTRVGIAVTRLQTFDSLKETNYGRIELN